MPEYVGKTYLYLFPFLIGHGSARAARPVDASGGIHPDIDAHFYHLGRHRDSTAPDAIILNVMFLAVAILLFLAGGGTFTIDRIIKAGSSGKRSSARI